MKRRSALLIVLLFLCVAFIATADNAVILEQSGAVTVVLSGAERAEPAVTGQPLGPGDVVNTGTDGTVIILLSDGSRIDLFPNSRLQVRDKDTGSQDGGGFLSRLWRSITGKFADSEYASAQAGGVGALRASVDDEEMFNDYASSAQLDEMCALLTAVTAEDMPEGTTALMKAIVYEEFGQFIPAEAIYLDRIAATPDDPVTYDMLFDMYLKMDLYGHAAAIAEKKAVQFSGADTE